VSYATAYEDFVIVAKRRNAREIGFRIDTLPAGRMAEEVTVAFPVEEGVELRASFFGGSARGERAEITIDEAVAIGTRLADVLFPKTAFRLFAESLGAGPTDQDLLRLGNCQIHNRCVMKCRVTPADADVAILLPTRSKPAGRRFEKS
jgi:hypothetical protein